tara:strand:- start:3466 stop:3684 length:219 start_codon:yes stop_codon:yes gene_type:complete
MKVDWHQIKNKYPFDTLESHFERIEKLGYKVYPFPDSCQIYYNNQMIIDADFHDDFHQNAAEAIECFNTMRH